MTRKLQAFIFAFICFVSMMAQERTITGTVMDGEFKGEPLMGATVTTGTGKAIKGVVTDLEGKFTIKVPADTKKLQVSYMGYKTYSLTLKPSVNTYQVTL